jgi:hypothetical protein
MSRRTSGSPLLPVAGAWVASRLSLMLLVVLGSSLLGLDAARRSAAGGSWVLDRFTYWDSFHFTRIAERGYLPPGLPCCDQAFFPGYPLAIRVLSPVTGGNEMLAGILISLAASTAAAMALWQLAVAQGLDARRAATAVAVLAVAPYGIFLSAVYSESLFLAVTVAAWWAAETRRWWWAGALAAAATAVRINGMFLVAALAVMYLVQLREDRQRRPRPDVLALALPFVVLGAYFGYLFARTGAWNAWQVAQDTGWARRTAWPWTGLQAGWEAIQVAPTPDLLVSRWADLLSVVGGLVLLGALLWLRRWAEATYIALSVGVLVCSTMITSAPRYALMWFPAYLLLARLVHRPGWGWLRVAVPALCLPLMAALALTFSARLWVS